MIRGVYPRIVQITNISPWGLKHTIIPDPVVFAHPMGNRFDREQFVRLYLTKKMEWDGGMFGIRIGVMCWQDVIA